ncbi:TRAP transporter small permease subunit [Actinoplanes sp. NPDC051861]|uniref:TRAP transporter small permease n=1 Tax=Actinoplanes sp. NPDC051861 TaxID=3155170 RepID=UPI00341B0A7E
MTRSVPFRRRTRPDSAAEAEREQGWREPAMLRAWGSIELWIAVVALTVIFLSVLWQVISRYVPALNWQGVGELAGYSLIVLTFIMVGYLIGNNGHITIQIIDYLVKGRAFTVVKAISAACTAVICAALAWEAYNLIVVYAGRHTAALGIPLWILYAVPLIGFTSGAIRAVVRVFAAGHEDAPFDAAEAR